MLLRTLEPEVMDSDDDAREYDAMDHRAVNAQFVTDLEVALTNWSLKPPCPRDAAPFRILDLGAGTAQIPIELARRAPDVDVTAIDAAESMLKLARKNVAAAGLLNRIELIQADAKRLPFDSAAFSVVVSNSIVHHIAEPRVVIGEAVRVTMPGGLLFHRDLVRPNDETQLIHLVGAYAGDATPYQRKLFADSLRAALTLGEVQQLVAEFGFSMGTVRMSSDRHWTWAAIKKVPP
jgi:ubiquinone/menaquinone biosynthesis C-methylase UbiE